MFEQGVIRPPSEASSLLVRVTRNCPWNRCLFCPAYKGKTFSRRSVEEIKGDIDRMTEAYGSHSGRITSAFLQDADSLILPTDELVEIIGHIKAVFPAIERVTTYARAKTMKRRSPEAYRRLKEAGLTRIHSGMESGSIEVLKLIKKGITPEDIVQGGQRVKEAGISLSEYIMPGIGGRRLSKVHALETANVLNQIAPDFIRVRTFAVPPGSPFQRLAEAGDFEPMTDEEIVAEIRLLIQHLAPMPSHFRCGDFSLNLLMQVDGRLDRKRESMIRELDRFLGLSKEEKQAYILLQRSYPGQYDLDVIREKGFMERVRKEIEHLESEGGDGFNTHIHRLKARQLPRPQTANWV